MHTHAVVLQEPERLLLQRLDLIAPAEDEITVDVEWSGISTGTERLLWSGKMPPFPGMGYPLVPGYEAVGRILHASPLSRFREGERVFVPGAKCFGEVRGLFGAAASRLVVSERRIVAIPESLGEQGVLLALAATAYHAIHAPGACVPERIVGHGVLGRLLARITMAIGGDAPVVWEKNPARRGGADNYAVIDPSDDPRRDLKTIYDVSGDGEALDSLIARLAPGGEVVLAGFYSAPLSFAFPPAFMREARLRVAAEWRPQDLVAVRELIEDGKLSLQGLITHREAAEAASGAYRTAFDDPTCLKMILDWRATS